VTAARRATVQRATSETKIDVELVLDGTGRHDVTTPLPFLTHMLEQLARHGRFDLVVRAAGDVHIDGHHTTEDLGIVLGRAFAESLGDRAGIRRYGEATIPMDEALCQVAVDFGGRPFFVDRLSLPKAKVGEFDVELGSVFLEAFARAALVNLHVRRIEGENLHHVLEGTFKALARAVSDAVTEDPRAGGVPSTKGTLT
jgi:imidazoleglycerol-phosphate dehydratase